MELKVFVEEAPRTVFLVAESYALTFRHLLSATKSFAARKDAITPRCIVQFSTAASLDLSRCRQLGHGYGTLGLIAFSGDVFLCVVTDASQIAAVRPGETVNKINTVEFCTVRSCTNATFLDHANVCLDCLSSSEYDYDHDPNFNEMESFGNRNYETTYNAWEGPVGKKIENLKKLLDDGSFYYSVDFNLTNRLQDR